MEEASPFDKAKRKKDGNDSFGALSKKWKICICILVLLCLVLLVVLVAIAVRSKLNKADHVHSTVDASSAATCTSPFKQNLNTEQGDPNIFQDLTESELKAVHKYLHEQASLNLTVFEKATLRDNFVYGVELLLPNKDDVLSYLDKGGSRPQRRARAIIFHGNSNDPFVGEYIVEGLPQPTTHRALKLQNQKERIPYYGRPFTFLDTQNMFPLLSRETEELYPLLKESFGCWVHNCTDHCLHWFPIGEPGRNVVGKRYSWIQFHRRINRQLQYLMLVPLQILVEYSDINNPQIVQVVYNNQNFDNTKQLMAKYRAGTLKVIHAPPPNKTQLKRASIEQRGPKQPSVPLRGPILVEPNGKRFSVEKNRVSYMNWQFEYGIRATGGLGLYDVRFQGKRIAYEISLQEAAAFYSGHSPETSNRHFIDTTWGLGTSNTYLMKEIDCPSTAVFVDTTHLMQSSTPVKNVQSMCIFETNTGTPLWRHFDIQINRQSTGVEGMRFQGGMAGHALVIRVISTPFNYDYAFDYVLHQSGVVEVRAASSGYIQPSFATEQEKQYGFVNFFNTIGTPHDHSLLYKVDLDVAGVKNSYQTVESVARNVSYEWQANTYRIKKQIMKSKKAREKDAVLRYNFDKPKYYVFTNENEKNAYGNPKGYRIDIQSKVKQLYDDDYFITAACAWTKYQMAVTKRKDLEPYGSSVYNQFTIADPAVNFDSMLNDNEAIENEDLVAWVNIGGLHLPNTEDIPLTTTVGGSYGFLIKPFGYFDEDPSHSSTTSVFVDKTADGKYDVKTYGTPETSSCPVPKRKPWM